MYVCVCDREQFVHACICAARMSATGLMNFRPDHKSMSTPQGVKSYFCSLSLLICV